MRWIVASLAVLLTAPVARSSEGIVAVLARSQLARLEVTRAADPASPRAQVVRGSFETLLRTLDPQRPIELQVIRGEAVAETVQGRFVLANERLAELLEGERLFILAHEIGHIELGHWAETERLYEKWVPGAVTPRETEPVAALLGRDALGQAHRHELEADAYALRALHALGHDSRDALGAFMRLGAKYETATHPGTGQRLASLRAAEADMPSAVARPLNRQATTRNEPIDSLRRVD